MNEQVKEILEWYEVQRFNIFDSESPELFEALKSAYESPLPRKEVISIQPGDVVAVMYPGSLSTKVSICLKEQIREIFPRTDVIILEDGMSLEVYREQVKDG